MQLTLIPWAVVGVVFIVVGYPAAVGVALFKWRALVAEDQVLRAAKLVSCWCAEQRTTCKHRVWG